MDKDKILLLPFLGLVAYTFGALFLLISPTGVYLSPGDSPVGGTWDFLGTSIGLLVATFVIFIVAWYKTKGGRKDV